MKRAIGTCKYCGQTMALEVPESFKQGDIDDEATEKCTCPEAHAMSEINQMIIGAKADIREIFKGKEEDLKELKFMLETAIEPIAHKRLEKITVAAGPYTASMKRKPASIETSLKYTSTEKAES